MKTRPIGSFGVNGNSWQSHGLVFWLPLIRSAPYDMVSRKIGTIAGAPIFSPDGLRPSWNFNGTTEYISFASPVTGVPLTLVCYGYQRSAATRTAFSIVNSADTTNYFSLEYVSTPSFRARTSDGTVSSASTTTAPTALVWNHIAGVFAAVNSRAAYLNGGSKGTQTSTRTPTGINTIRVGALGGSTISEFLNGNGMDFRIYNRALSDAEIAAMVLPQEMWELYDQPAMRFYSLGPTIVNLNVSGSISPSGVLGKQPNKLFSGAIGPSGVILKKPSKLFAGAIGPSGVNLKKPVKLFLGAITPSGALLKQPGKIISGSVTPSGTVKKQPNKLFSGAIGPTGSLLKSISTRVMSGTVSFAGGLIKQPKKLFGGSISPAGSLLKQLAKLFSGTIGPTGALLKQPYKLLSGVLSFAGDITVFRVIFIALAGSLSFVGNLSKQPTKLFGGSVQPVGALLKQPFKLLAGSISPSGVLSTIRTKLLQLAGSLSFNGTLTKTPKKLYVGTVSFLGSLLKQPAKHFSGTLTISGTISTLKVVFLFLAGSLSFTGEVTKTVYKRFAGNVSFTGILQTVHIVVSTGEVKFREMWKNMFRKMR